MAKSSERLPLRFSEEEAGGPGDFFVEVEEQGPGSPGRGLAGGVGGRGCGLLVMRCDRWSAVWASLG